MFKAQCTQISPLEVGAQWRGDVRSAFQTSFERVCLLSLAQRSDFGASMVSSWASNKVGFYDRASVSIVRSSVAKSRAQSEQVS